jgi:hypothetical protein
VDNNAPWFARILVLFECYSYSAVYRRSRTSDAPPPRPFSPPVVEAVQALRQALAIIGSRNSRLEHTTLVSLPLLSLCRTLLGSSAWQAAVCSVQTRVVVRSGGLPMVVHQVAQGRVCDGYCPRWCLSELLSRRDVVKRATKSLSPPLRRCRNCLYLLVLECRFCN